MTEEEGDGSRGWHGIQTLSVSNFNSSLWPLQWEALVEGGYFLLAKTLRQRTAAILYFILTCFLLFVLLGNTHHKKNPRFSLFPNYFKHSPNLLSPTFSHSHCLVLPTLPWVSMFWCPSPPCLCWWQYFTSCHLDLLCLSTPALSIQF